MEAFLSSHLGELPASRLVSLLGGICEDDLTRFSTLTENIVRAATQHSGVSDSSALQALGLARRLSGGASQSGPWLPPRAPPARRPLNFAASSSTFASVHPRVRPGRLWVEEVAAGRVSHTGALLVALEDVFTESDRITGLNASARRDRPKVFSFVDRCRASGCLALVTPWELDQAQAKRPRLSGGARPQERVLALRVGPVDVLSPALRHPADLSVEAGIRILFSSISASWRAYSSGIRTWALFVDTMFPFTPHFPAQWDMLVSYGSIFSNPDSLGRYLSHLRFAHRVLRLDDSAIKELSGPLRRGPRRHFAPKPRPFASRHDLEKLVKLAVSRQCLLDARAYVILFDFMLRASGELWPLQIDGSGSAEPHSRISFTNDSATIWLEHRKNAPHGDSVTRKCVCSCGRLCGVCSLRALVDSHVKARGSPRSPLFGQQWSSAALRRLHDFCSALGISKLSWHSFRRGGASEMLRSGSAVAQILVAGGWRSAAFIRYLRTRDIDARAALEVAYAASDSD